VKEYYERRAAEYDATSYAQVQGPELERLEACVAALPPGRVLDVACGTGYLTRHLRGTLTALDQGPAMLEIARARVPAATLVRADVPPLPFGDNAFDLVFTGSFYSHLAAPLRAELVAEALRVGAELVVVEEAWRAGLPHETWETRTLADGTRWPVFKRYFTAGELSAELGGDVLLATPRFIVARRRRA